MTIKEIRLSSSCCPSLYSFSLSQSTVFLQSHKDPPLQSIFTKLRWKAWTIIQWLTQPLIASTTSSQCSCPEWGLAVAHALRHQALPRLGAHLCRSCSYLSLGMKSYKLPTPKHVPPPLPKLARTVWRTVGSKVGQLQWVEKTIRHLVSPLWRERPALMNR